jgi:hypothetical protein
MGLVVCKYEDSPASLLSLFLTGINSNCGRFCWQIWRGNSSCCRQRQRCGRRTTSGWSKRPTKSGNATSRSCTALLSTFTRGRLPCWLSWPRHVLSWSPWSTTTRGCRLHRQALALFYIPRDACPLCCRIVWLFTGTMRCSVVGGQ